MTLKKGSRIHSDNIDYQILENRKDFVFGPVHSRRLGLSLGIDCTPGTQCTYDCLYCEVGKTARLTTERKDYAPINAVLNQVESALADNPAVTSRIETITFSGSGEPTLHTRLGEMITALKKQYPSIPVTVITNGSTLYIPEVRESLLQADKVIPSVDAVSEDIWKKINRPTEGLDLSRILRGLEQFLQEYPGEVLIEVFILPGINNIPEEIRRIRDFLLPLPVNAVQINHLHRLPAYQLAKEAAIKELEEIQRWFLPLEAEIIT